MTRPETQRLHKTRRAALQRGRGGFLYLNGLKWARVTESLTIEFIDHRRSKAQPPRIIEVDPAELAAALNQLTQALE